MQSDEEGFLYPVISQEKCIHCKKCENVCPILHKPVSFPMESAFGCYAKNKEEQMSSTSGGIFAVLARKILSEGGIVCGAAFNDNLEVAHIIIDDEKELYRIKGTKYVQSRIGNIFPKLKQVLEAEKKVLFSGTPCQVSGLKTYLGKEYENLLCVDLICHGVPSPEVWKRYLEEIAGENQIKNVIFRNKEAGSSITTIDYQLCNGEIKKEIYGESPYIKGFIQNLYIRLSCVSCQFKGTKRCSDMTIGDFWSIKEYHPEFSNDYGTSAVILHSKKGQQWFEKCNDDLESVKAKTREIAVWNECLEESTKYNPQRDLFFEKWKEKNVAELIKALNAEFPKTELETNKKTVFSKIRSLLKI